MIVASAPCPSTGVCAACSRVRCLHGLGRESSRLAYHNLTRLLVQHPSPRTTGLSTDARAEGKNHALACVASARPPFFRAGANWCWRSIGGASIADASCLSGAMVDGGKLVALVFLVGGQLAESTEQRPCGVAFRRHRWAQIRALGCHVGPIFERPPPLAPTTGEALRPPQRTHSSDPAHVPTSPDIAKCSRWGFLVALPPIHRVSEAVLRLPGPSQDALVSRLSRKCRLQPRIDLSSGPEPHVIPHARALAISSMPNSCANIELDASQPQALRRWSSGPCRLPRCHSRERGLSSLERTPVQSRRGLRRRRLWLGPRRRLSKRVLLAGRRQHAGPRAALRLRPPFLLPRSVASRVAASSGGTRVYITWCTRWCLHDA